MPRCVCPARFPRRDIVTNRELPCLYPPFIVAFYRGSAAASRARRLGAEISLYVKVFLGVAANPETYPFWNKKKPRRARQPTREHRVTIGVTLKRASLFSEDHQALSSSICSDCNQRRHGPDFLERA